MKIVKHTNGVIEQYPHTLRRIRADNPTSSIPDKPSPQTLARYGCAYVEEAPQPSYDSFTQSIREGVPIPNGGSWEQTWVVESLSPEQAVVNIEQAKARLLEAATAKRWGVETGGMVLPNGVHVATGTEDQNRITAVIANARLAGVEAVDFKAASGWVSLTLPEIEAIASAIALHVQACFSAERVHHEAIDLLVTAQELGAYDVNAGWWHPDADVTPPSSE